MAGYGDPSQLAKFIALSNAWWLVMLVMQQRSSWKVTNECGCTFQSGMNSLNND